MKRTLIPALLVSLAACASSPGGGAPAEGGEPAPRGAERGGPPRPLTPAQKAALRVEKLEIRPGELTLQVGDSARVEVVALDSAGNRVEDAQLGRFVRGRAATYDASTEQLKTVEPGEATFFAVLQKPDRGGKEERRSVVARAEVTVTPLPVARVEVEAPSAPVYAGTRVRIRARPHSRERRRDDATVRWRSSDPSLAEVSEHGLLETRRPGRVTVTATAEGVSGSTEVRVRENPIRSLELTVPRRDVKVGEVLHLGAVARDAAGEAVEGAPVEWTVEGPRGEMSEEAYLDDSGAFVAEAPGLFRVTATVGSRSATAEISAEPRPYRNHLEVVGHGVVKGHASSDLWVFQGVDGRDYAYTGTHAAGAGGNVMYAWDVTDPSDPAITDSVVVDARVVNDVKVNETRNLAVITREGASDRKNGIVLLDIRVPAHPKVFSSYTENLTAGVHNVWIEGDLVYAVNDGTRALHVIDISDPARPRQVGRWQIDREQRYLHDVIVKDGLAYLSYWDDGLVILDVGRGIEGGTPTDPKLVSQFTYRSRWGAETYGNTHHAYPYGDYVFLGDEIFGCSECVNGPRGHVHVVDVSDVRQPRQVASFRVPEAGTHNQWVEDGKLYMAYYQGGLRVVDVTGELRGDLYDQDREIGWFQPDAGEDEAFRPNAAMTWGAQPYGGHIYAIDMNSGLWILDWKEESEGDDGS